SIPHWGMHVNPIGVSSTFGRVFVEWRNLSSGLAPIDSEAVERQPVRTLEPSRHIEPAIEAIGLGKTLERVSLECLAGNERVALDDQHWLNRSAPSHGKPPTRPSSHPGIQVQRVSRLRVAAVLPVRSDRLALLAALDGIGELRSEIQRWHQTSLDTYGCAPDCAQAGHSEAL